MWRKLRERKPWGFHFRKQVPLGPFVADFVLFASKLVIELDGETHSTPEQLAHDNRRTAWLSGNGFTVMRFSNHEIMSSLNDVAQTILNTVETLPKTQPDQSS